MFYLINNLVNLFDSQFLINIGTERVILLPFLR